MGDVITTGLASFTLTRHCILVPIIGWVDLVAEINFFFILSLLNLWTPDQSWTVKDRLNFIHFFSVFYPSVDCRPWINSSWVLLSFAMLRCHLYPLMLLILGHIRRVLTNCMNYDIPTVRVYKNHACCYLPDLVWSPFVGQKNLVIFWIRISFTEKAAQTIKTDCFWANLPRSDKLRSFFLRVIIKMCC